MDTPRVIAETPDFLVIEKPEGLLVHPGPHSGDEATLTAWLLPRYPEIRVVGDAPETRPGIVHRLDRGTSGVMLVARTRQAFADLKELFQSREMKKEYRALVHGVMHPAEGRIDRAIGIKPHTTKRSVFSTQMSKPAVTRYETVEQLAAIAHVAAFPETGRTHQIRVHFSSLGHPVLGDTLYAPKRKDPAVTRLMLHAHRISFTYRGVENTFTSDVPEAFETVLHTQRVLAEGGV
jgi:23S rRNA pseudouridine1911/1915/1917 synthase